MVWKVKRGREVCRSHGQVHHLPWLAVIKICQLYHWRRQWHPTPVLLPGKSHGRRSLVGCSPWGRKESDMTERLHFHFSLSCIGEENGNPLKCSCLENPRDRGAWWAAISGVTQSWTRLKRLISSSSRYLASEISYLLFSYFENIFIEIQLTYSVVQVNRE